MTSPELTFQSADDRPPLAEMDRLVLIPLERLRPEDVYAIAKLDSIGLSDLASAAAQLNVPWLPWVILGVRAERKEDPPVQLAQEETLISDVNTIASWGIEILRGVALRDLNPNNAPVMWVVSGIAAERSRKLAERNQGGDRLMVGAYNGIVGRAIFSAREIVGQR